MIDTGWASATIADDDEIVVISKYVAEREKDLDFSRTAIAHGLVEEETLRLRLEGAPIDEPRRRLIADFVSRDFAR